MAKPYIIESQASAFSPLLLHTVDFPLDFL
jgi:hypothetical protein